MRQLPVFNNEAFGQRFLRIAGWILFLAGLLNGVGGHLLTFLSSLGDDFWWNATAIVLFFAFRDDSRRRYCRAAACAMFGLWLIPPAAQQWALRYNRKMCSVKN